MNASSKFQSLRFLLLSFLFATATGLLAGESSQADRFEAAFLLSHGRLPSAEELAEGAEMATGSVSDLYSKLAKESSSPEVAAFAYLDVFGIEPTNAGDGGSYWELSRQHLATLESDAEAYEAVINRAYKYVINRDVYEEEIAYWKEHGVFTYTMLVACVEDWAKRNQPGLMVTAGTPTVSVNSEYLTTLRLSPALAAEVREAIGGLEEARIIHPGAKSLKSGGGIHLIATGGMSRDFE